MEINKISLMIIVFCLGACSSISAPVPISTETKTTSTFTSAPIDTRQSTETPEFLPTIKSSQSPTLTQSVKLTQGSCYQSAKTQIEMNACTDQQAQETYAKLNSLIGELQGHMSDSQYTTLLKIESDWEKMITEHCQWEANFSAGGSIQPMQFSGCLSQQYMDRIEMLRINLCEGHGMTGECEESLKYKN